MSIVKKQPIMTAEHNRFSLIKHYFKGTATSAKISKQ